MKTGNLVHLITLLLASAFFLGNKPASEQRRTVTVGLIYKFGESYDGTVGSMMKGIETAVHLASSRSKNLDIKLVKYSHTDDLGTVISACNQAVSDRVDVVIGGEDSNHAIVMSELLGKAKITFLTPTATNPKVTELSDRTYALSMNDALVSKLLAEFVTTHLKAKKIGVLRGVSSPYTDYLSQKFHEHVSAKPGTEVFEHRYLRGAVNFKPAIEDLKKRGVDHIAMLSYESSLVHLWNQSENLGYEPIYIGADGWGTSKVIRSKLFTGTSENSKAVAYQTAYWHEDASHKTAQLFRKTFETLHKSKANAWSAVAFDAGHVLFSTLSNIKGPITSDAIKHGLDQIKSMEVATSKDFRFSSDRSAIKSIAIYKIDNRGVEFEAMIP